MSLFAKYLTKSFLHYTFTAIAHQNTGMLASWNITSRNSSFCELLFRRNISLLLCISGITIADTYLSRMFPNDKCPPKLQLYIQQICTFNKSAPDFQWFLCQSFVTVSELLEYSTLTGVHL